MRICSSKELLSNSSTDGEGEGGGVAVDAEALASALLALVLDISRSGGGGSSDGGSSRRCALAASQCLAAVVNKLDHQPKSGEGGSGDGNEPPLERILSTVVHQQLLPTVTAADDGYTLVTGGVGAARGDKWFAPLDDPAKWRKHARGR